MQYLEKEGARFDIKTNSGQNVLHLAAQSNQAQTFIFFKDKININSRDFKLSTPLHWAAFSGNENIVDYLLADSKCELDSKDEDLQTPLHLAVLNGEGKIIRKLLIAGADKRILNKKKEIPLNIA